MISSLFVALALFFAPLVMASGSGMAMPHAAAEEMMDAGRHCPGGDVPSEEKESEPRMSCASACAAFPALSPAVAAKTAPSPAEAMMAGDQLLAGIHPEGETPPPRVIPAI